MSICIRELKDEDVELVEGFAAEDPFNPYRNYPLAKTKGKGPLFAREIWHAKNDGDMTLWAALHRDRCVGLIGLDRLKWDSGHFGIPMARLWPFSLCIHECGDPRLVAERLLQTALELSTRWGIRHVACRVTGENFFGIHSLQRAGFLMMDTLVTYLYRRGKSRAPECRGKYKVRLYQEEDLPQILNIAREAVYEGRFTRDPWVQVEKVTRMYEAWSQRCCERSMADEVLVAEAGEEVRGFLGYRMNTFFTEQTGLELWGGGLSVVARKGVGAYASLLAAAVTREFEGRDHSVQPNVPDLIDFETQLSNSAILRVWQEFGYLMVRFTHAFHRGFNGQA